MTSTVKETAADLDLQSHDVARWMSQSREVAREWVWYRRLRCGGHCSGKYEEGMKRFRRKIDRQAAKWWVDGRDSNKRPAADLRVARCAKHHDSTAVEEALSETEKGDGVRGIMSELRSGDDWHPRWKEAVVVLAGQACPRRCRLCSFRRLRVLAPIIRWSHHIGRSCATLTEL